MSRSTNGLTSEQKVFYRKMLAVVSDKTIEDLLVAYAKIGYDRALNNLRQAKDMHEVGRFQGEMKAWDELANIKANTINIIQKADK